MQTSRVAVRPIDTLLRESSVQHSQLARDDRRPPASVDDVNAISSLERLNDLRAELRQHKRAHIALFGDDGNGDLEAVLQSERALASDGDQLAGELTEHFQRLDQLVSPTSSSSLALSSNRTHQHHGHSGRELMRAQTIISRLTGTSGDAHHHHSHNHHHGHHSHHRPSRAASEGSLPVSLSNALDTVAIDGRGLHNTMPIPSDQAQFLSQSVQRAIADGPAQSSTYPLSYMDNDTASITSVNTTASEVGNGWMKLDTVTSTTSTTSTDTDDDLFAWSQLSKVMESAYDLSTLSQVGHPSSISARGITAVGTTLGYVLIYDEKHSLRALLGQDKISDSDPDDFDDNSGRASKTVDERHQQPQSDSFGATVCIAIAADRSTIAVGYSCGTCAVWDWKKNAHIATITPVTLRDVQSGSRLGHIRGNAVNHVAFLGASSSKIVTSDITGQVFLHELSRRIVPNRSVSTETRRVAGRYPPEALGFDAPQSHSGAAADNSRRLLDISVLPLGAQAHPADKMDLVAVLTPSALTVVSVAKTVRELLRFPSPSRFVPQHGSVVWHPTSAFTSAVGQRYSTQPLLAYSLDTTITVATLMRNGATDSPSPSLECRAIAEWTSPSSIAMLYWLSASVLLAIDTTGALWTLELPSDALSIIATRQSSNPVASSPLPSALAAVARSGNVFTDSPTSSPRGSIDLMRIGVSPSSQGTSDEYGDSDNVLPSLRPTRIRHSIGFHPMSLDDSSFSIYRGRVFALGSDRITCGILSTWTSRLISLVGRGELLAALTYARELYLGCTNQITIGLPSEDELVADTATTTTIVERRHEAVGPVLMALVRSTLTYISGLAGTREEDETSVFGYEDMVDLATQLVEACLALQPSNESLFECMAAGSDVQHRPLSTSCLYVPDDLLSDICDAFSSTGSDSIEAALMDAVEIFVADGRLGHRLPPEVAHSLIGHLARGLDGDVQVAHRLESCIVHIHPMALDVDQVATIARRKSQQPMWDAVSHVWCRGLNDFITPLRDMISAGAHSFALDYLANILGGGMYPDGAPIGTAEVIRVTIAQVTQKIAIPVNSSSPKMVNGSLAARYPLLWPLVAADANGVADMLSNVMSASIESPGDEVEESRLVLATTPHLQQCVIEALVDMAVCATGDELSNNAVLHLLEFAIGRIVIDSRLMRFSEQRLLTICDRIVSTVESSPQSDYSIVQIARSSLGLLIPTHINPLSDSSSEFVERCKKCNLWNIVGAIAASSGNIWAATESYLADSRYPERQLQVFDYIHTQLSNSSVDSATVTTIVTEHIAVLVKIDVAALQQLVDSIAQCTAAEDGSAALLSHESVITCLRSNDQQSSSSSSSSLSASTASSSGLEFRYLRELLLPATESSRSTASSLTELHVRFFELCCAKSTDTGIAYLKHYQCSSNSPSAAISCEQAMLVAREHGAVDVLAYLHTQSGDYAKALCAYLDCIRSETSRYASCFANTVHSTPESTTSDNQDTKDVTAVAVDWSVESQTLALDAVYGIKQAVCAAIALCKAASSSPGLLSADKCADLWYDLLAAAVVMTQTIATCAVRHSKATSPSNNENGEEAVTASVPHRNRQDWTGRGRDACIISSLLTSAFKMQDAQDYDGLLQSREHVAVSLATLAQTFVRLVVDGLLHNNSSVSANSVDPTLFAPTASSAIHDRSQPQQPVLSLSRIIVALIRSQSNRPQRQLTTDTDVQSPTSTSELRLPLVEIQDAVLTILEALRGERLLFRLANRLLDVEQFRLIAALHRARRRGTAFPSRLCCTVCNKDLLAAKLPTLAEARSLLFTSDTTKYPTSSTGSGGGSGDTGADGSTSATDDEDIEELRKLAEQLFIRWMNCVSYRATDSVHSIALPPTSGLDRDGIVIRNDLADLARRRSIRLQRKRDAFGGYHHGEGSGDEEMDDEEDGEDGGLVMLPRPRRSDPWTATVILFACGHGAHRTCAGEMKCTICPTHTGGPCFT